MGRNRIKFEISLSDEDVSLRIDPIAFQILIMLCEVNSFAPSGLLIVRTFNMNKL